MVATCAAVLTWFVLYRGIYVHDWSPGLPGETGPFKYVLSRTARPPDLPRGRRGPCDHQHHAQQSRWAPKDDVPKFMGMPLYGYKKDGNASAGAGGSGGGGAGDEGEPGGGGKRARRPRSRSGSVNRFSASKNSLNSKY